MPVVAQKRDDVVAQTMLSPQTTLSLGGRASPQTTLSPQMTFKDQLGRL
jgi:hypothetical protein